MNFDQIVAKFKRQPYWVKMGAGKLSKRWKCSKDDIYKAREAIRSSNSRKSFPKILIFDIEISPSISYTFGRFKYNINWDQVEQEPIMLTWAAKWLYSGEVMSDKITTNEVLNCDDSRITKSLWDLMNEADIVVAHYGDGFDVPVMNTRAILNGLPPYNTVNSIDTKKVASRTFKFPSNKLDALCSYFNLDGKIHTEFQLWIDCLKGDKSAIDNMETYNIQDTKALEDVYLKLRPYIKAHPNVSLYSDKATMQCSSCGSSNLKEDGFYYTSSGKYQNYRCECGALSRGRSTILDKDKRKSLLVSVGK